MNHVSLIGRLTKDLELRKVPSGTSVVTFTLAVNRRFKAEGQPDADFIRCTAWGKTADVMCQYLNKGSQIGVEGRIQTGQYQDKNGSMVYTTDIVVENFDFLGSRNNNGGMMDNGSNNYNSPSYPEPEPMDDSQDNSTLDIASDDLPF